MSIEDIWPFQPDWAMPIVVDKPVLVSRAISGALKAREKGDSTEGLALQFTTRDREEWDAAVAFWKAHYPADIFTYRDYSKSPFRVLHARFATRLEGTFNGYNDIDYSFELEILAEVPDPFLRIDAGRLTGDMIDGWVEDIYAIHGPGGTDVSFTGSPDFGSVVDPAPASIYLTAHKNAGTLKYLIPDRTPNSSQCIRLHFYDEGEVGSYLEMLVNGPIVSKLNYAASELGKVQIREFYVNANNDGEINLDMVLDALPPGLVGDPPLMFLNAIEIAEMEPPTDGTIMNIICAGDSNTIGWPYALSSYPYELYKLLQELGHKVKYYLFDSFIEGDSDATINVINVGKSGQTLTDIYNAIDTRIAARAVKATNVLILAAGTNDLLNETSEEVMEGAYPFFFASELLEDIDHTVIMSIPPCGAEPFDQEVADNLNIFLETGSGADEYADLRTRSELDATGFDGAHWDDDQHAVIAEIVYGAVVRTGAIADGLAPTAPTALSLVAVSDTELLFTHDADSTDLVGVTGYEVRIAPLSSGVFGTAIDVDMSATHNFTSLLANPSYPTPNYKAQARAYDAAGNRSEWSNIVYGASLEDIPEAFNVALASNGATASSSSTSIAGAASTAIDGIRHTSNNWGGGTGFASADSPSGGSPVTFEVDFGTSRTISGINLFFLASSVNYNTDPTLSDTSASYAANAFDVQYWNGSTWITIDSASGNTNVRKEFTFSPVVTTKARIRCTAAGSDGRLFLVEFEAWGY